MEWLWYVLAALAAGVGTGLAGLSAATVMVPMLIVLCPSFAGTTGAYHATAIALASDILGSAFTAAVYIRHKHIDLKRGWLMLVCILAMCIVGSIAAWYAGHVVLGTFSLFLCVAIGIRFLVKPETQKVQTAALGERLDWKGIAISLFFGLTIGFGTGFVGSGGGMMMLVVFTAFLGMEQRTAVGTSTLIMTFTALIAFGSHALIEPTILFDRWEVLLVCMVTETAASILSAQYANRVSSRMVSLVTGWILTIFGAFLLMLHYREALAANQLLMNVLACLGKYLLYLSICVAALLAARWVIRFPKEVWRKSLHAVAYTSSIFMMAVSGDWLAASISCAVFALIVYPVLRLFEGWKGYDGLFVQRRKGEIKRSLLLLFFTHAVLIACCWGWLGKPYLALTAIFTWGVGDTMAALVGKRWGKHLIRFPLADPHKTWEGTGAMAGASFVVATALLVIASGYAWYVCALLGALAAITAAYVELITHNGYDTVTVPTAVALALAFVTGVMG
ncbi:MAG: TSUP family transporter [Clostridia bacterium]|nr:TSUP family transporter [Clostridia bacterium]